MGVYLPLKAIAFELWINTSMEHWKMFLLSSPLVPTEKMKVEGHFENHVPHFLGLFSVSFRVRTGKTRNKLMKKARSRECKIIIGL